MANPIQNLVVGLGAAALAATATGVAAQTQEQTPKDPYDAVSECYEGIESLDDKSDPSKGNAFLFKGENKTPDASCSVTLGAIVGPGKMSPTFAGSAEVNKDVYTFSGTEGREVYSVTSGNFIYNVTAQGWGSAARIDVYAPTDEIKTSLAEEDSYLKESLKDGTATMTELGSMTHIVFPDSPLGDVLPEDKVDMMNNVMGVTLAMTMGKDLKPNPDTEARMEKIYNAPAPAAVTP